MPSDSLNARAPLRLAAFGGKNYNGSRRVEKPRARPMALKNEPNPCCLFGCRVGAMGLWL